MTDFRQHRFAAQFVLRTPLLPYTELLRWASDTRAPKQAVPDDATLEADRTELRRRLAERLATPAVAEALNLASPGLMAAQPRWDRDPDSRSGRKFERAVTRYFVRMCSRPTPYGALSGVSLGTVGRRDCVELVPRAGYRVQARASTALLFEVQQRLEADPDVRARARYRSNTSVHRVGSELRFYAARSTAGQRTYVARKIEADEVVECVLQWAQRGATRAELAQRIDDDLDIEASEAERHEYIDDLIDEQLLTSDLEPPLCSRAPLEPWLGSVQRVGAAELAHDLRAMAGTLARHPRLDAADGSARRRAATAIWPGLNGAPSHRRLHCDLFKPTREAQLSSAVLGRVKKGLEVLGRFARRRRGGRLQDFAAAFSQRFGQREVPLLHALDPDVGVGFPVGGSPQLPPLLAGVGSAPPPAAASPVPWDGRDRLLLGKLQGAWRTGACEIELTPDDLSALPAPEQLPLDAMVVKVQIDGAHGDEARPPRIWIEHTLGPSWGRLLGRFANGQPSIVALMDAEAQSERAAHPGALVAELVHVPPAVSGDVLGRPHTRDYVIEYLGASEAGADRRLRLDDLVLCVRSGRVVLRSQSHDREVVVRVSNAHEHRLPHNLPVYRLLCDLQFQGRQPPLWWDWGVLDDAPSLPRVRVGDVVLAPARWRLSLDQVSCLRAASPNDAYRRLNRWRREQGWPRVVGFVDGHFTLAVDLDNVLSVEAFVAALDRPRDAVLVELPGSTGDALARGPEGRYASELLLMLRRKAEPSPGASPTLQIARAPTAVRRTFAPGSAWMQAELYGGPGLLDDLLLDGVSPLLDELADDPPQWWFVRYGLPRWHLRLRLHVPDPTRRAHVRQRVECMAAEQLSAGRIDELCWSTYHRELERYGAACGIQLAERLFHADSEAALAMLAAADGVDGGARWRWSLVGVDRLLADLGLSIEQRCEYVGRVRGVHARHHGGHAEPIGRAMAARFRRERPRLESLLFEGEGVPAAVERALQQRSTTVRPLASRLRDAAAEQRLGRSWAELVASYVHMHTNRMFRAHGHAQELAVHDLLHRLYTSVLRRRPLASTTNTG
ncbi:MAG: lantibiotic dehydratase [Deltaproteobacteria bacterium]|nr:lantibiotic dehydratase [Deltaproteobacteria bacterium]